MTEYEEQLLKERDHLLKMLNSSAEQIKSLESEVSQYQYIMSNEENFLKERIQQLTAQVELHKESEKELREMVKNLSAKDDEEERSLIALESKLKYAEQKIERMDCINKKLCEAIKRCFRPDTDEVTFHGSHLPTYMQSVLKQALNEWAEQALENK